MNIWCCKCNKVVNAGLVKGDVIYPHRPDLYKKNFYKCPKCGNYVGCHDKTTRPLGCIPTYPIKIARQKLHAKMDPLWKSGKITRTALYRLISKRLGYTYHNGSTKSVQECMEVWDIVDKIEKDLN
jgi:hypothetical protein